MEHRDYSWKWYPLYVVYEATGLIHKVGEQLLPVRAV